MSSGAGAVSHPPPPRRICQFFLDEMSPFLPMLLLPCHCFCHPRWAAAVNTTALPLPPRRCHCCQCRTATAFVAALLPSCHHHCCHCSHPLLFIVVVVAVIVTVPNAVASTAFSWLLSVVCAPAIAVATSVFVATAAARGNSTATVAAAAAAKLPLPLSHCHPHASAKLPLPPPPLPCCHRTSHHAVATAAAVLPPRPS